MMGSPPTIVSGALSIAMRKQLELIDVKKLVNVVFDDKAVQ